MSEKLKTFIEGFCSAFDMGPSPHETPDFLSSDKSAFQALTEDWDKLCDDGERAYREYVYLKRAH